MAEWALIIHSPVRFFRQRAAVGPPVWGLPVLIVGIYLALYLMSSLVMMQRMVPHMDAVLAAAGFPSGSGWLGTFAAGMGAMASGIALILLFWAQAGSVIALSLFASGSGHVRRLIECTALAHLPLALLGGVSLVYAVSWFEGVSFRVPNNLSSDDLPAIMTQFQRDMASTPISMAMSLVRACFGLWVIALQCS